MGYVLELRSRLQRGKCLSMASELRQRVSSVFLKSGAATSRAGMVFRAGPTGRRSPALAPWSKLTWRLFFPLVFAGNIAVAILAWFIVELVMN